MYPIGITIFENSMGKLLTLTLKKRNYILYENHWFILFFYFFLTFSEALEQQRELFNDTIRKFDLSPKNCGLVPSPLRF